MCMTGGCPGSGGYNPMASQNRQTTPAKKTNYVHRQGHMIGTSGTSGSKQFGEPRVKFSGKGKK